MRGIEACGPAGRLATRERYREKGYDAIPAARARRGPDGGRAPSAAGARAAISRRRSAGACPSTCSSADAIRHAREGCPVSPSEARYVPKELDTLHDAPNFAAAFLNDGKPRPAGEIRRLPALAATLEQLAHAGLDDFYRGDIGREIAADLERLDAPVTRADLAAYRPRERRPCRSAGATRRSTTSRRRPRGSPPS